MRASADDEQALVRYATALADGIESALPGWTVRCVTQRWREAGGGAHDDDLVDRAVRAGERCRDEVAPRVRELLLRDLDDQTTTPLALLRSAVHHPTQVLVDAGVPPVDRDEFSVRAFPDDRYALAPATFADLDESLAEPGLMWGAAKAHVHLARRRAEGRR